MNEYINELDQLETALPGQSITMFEKRDEWMNLRAGKWTSSEINKLISGPRAKEYFDKGAMTYIKTKAAERLTGQCKELFNIASLEWGNSNEQEALELYCTTTGNEVEYFGGSNPQFFAINETAGGSPDGLINTNGILEAKCPFDSGKHINYLMLKNAADLQKECDDYYAQMQMNMWATDRVFADFVSFDPRIKPDYLRLKVIRIPRDEFFIAELRVRIQRAETELQNIIQSLTS